MNPYQETFYTDAYKEGIEIQFQQMQNRLMPVLDGIGTQEGEFDWVDRVGTTSVREKTSRNSDVTFSDSEYDRRGVFTRYFYDSKLLDRMDQARMLSDPTNAWLTSMMAAHKRKMEDTIIAAATGVADAEVAGTKETVAFPASQVIPVDYKRTGSPANSSMTKDKMIIAKNKLITSEAVSEDEEIFLIVSQDELDDLLYAGDEFISGEYIDDKPAVNGIVGRRFGITLVRSERLLRDDDGNRICLMMPKGAIKLNMRGGMIGWTEEVTMKHKSLMLYLAGEYGAVRLWEEKVVAIKSNK